MVRKLLVTLARKVQERVNGEDVNRDGVASDIGEG